MIIRLLTAASAVALMTSASLAQSPGDAAKPNAPHTTVAPQGSSAQPMQNQMPMQFLQQQSSNEWRSSKLVGTQVTGANNQSIGEIEDVLFDSSGMVKGVVVGVGGFLGIGEKDVAIPFKALTVTRKADDDDIEKIAVTYTKEQLNQAPAFKYLADSGSRPTTGSSTNPAPAKR